MCRRRPCRCRRRVVDPAAAAGGAALFQNGGLAAVETGEGKRLLRAAHILPCDVRAVGHGYKVAPALGGKTGRGQAAQLLGAGGDEGMLFHESVKKLFVQTLAVAVVATG